jgi:hypothetical protein
MDDLVFQAMIVGTIEIMFILYMTYLIYKEKKNDRIGKH